MCICTFEFIVFVLRIDAKEWNLRVILGSQLEKGMSLTGKTMAQKAGLLAFRLISNNSESFKAGEHYQISTCFL